MYMSELEVSPGLAYSYIAGLALDWLHCCLNGAMVVVGTLSETDISHFEGANFETYQILRSSLSGEGWAIVIGS